MKSVFVSSTFRDMQAERDILALKVIPRLNAFAAEFGESVRFVDLRWGINTANMKDEEESSKKVLKVCFDEIEKTEHMIVLLGERYGWIPPESLVADTIKSKMNDIEDYKKSVTQLEIEYGSQKAERCLFYFRVPLSYEDIPEQFRGDYIEENQELKEKLSALKAKIIASGAIVRTYSCEWNKEQNIPAISDDFAKMVYEDVANLFEDEFTKAKDLSDKELEELSASLFSKQKSKQFIARTEDLAEYISDITNKNNNLFILKGEAGSGKSTMMSKIYESLKESNQAFFFAGGNSAYSLSAEDMLNQLIYKLEFLLKVANTHEDTAQLNTLEEKVARFEQLCYLYDTQADSLPLYFICDSLDSLTDDETLREFLWLPISLPPKITIVVSALKSFKLPNFMPLKSNSIVKHLKDIEKSQISMIARSIAEAEGKELDEDVAKELANISSTTSPLFISMALQRLMMFDREDYAQIAQGGSKINEYMLSVVRSFPKNEQDMCAVVLEEAARRIDKDFCMSVAALLASSRRGLRIEDLQAIFSKRNKVFDNVDFSLFTSYMRNFFMSRSDGRIDFTHKVIRLGFLKSVDFDKQNALILNHLKELDNTDELKKNELIFHAYKAEEKKCIFDYIEECYFSENIRNILARELHDITLKDESLVYSLIELCDVQNSNFAYFILDCFCKTFSMSIHELEIKKRITEKFTLKINELLSKSRDYDIELCLYMAHDIMGEIYKDLGNHEEALEYFKNSLNTATSLFDEYKKPVIYRSIASAHSKHGDVYNEQGDIDSAETSYENALEAFILLNKELDFSESQRDLASAYSKVGKCSEKLGNFTDALYVYEQNLNLCITLSKEKTARAMWDLLIAYGSLGALYSRLGNNELAIQNLQESLEVYKKHPHFFKKPEAVKDLAATYSNLSIVLKNAGKSQQAFDLLNENNRILEDLAKEFQTPQIKYDLAVSYHNLAINYEELDYTYEATEKYINAYKILDELSAILKTPQVLDLRIKVAEYIGDMYALDSDTDNVIKYLDAARSHIKEEDSWQDNFSSQEAMFKLSYKLGENTYNNEMYNESMDYFIDAETSAKYLLSQTNDPMLVENLAIVYLYIGNIHYLNNEHTQAIEHLTQATYEIKNHNSDNAYKILSDCHFMLAKIFANNDDISDNINEAVLHFEKAAEVSANVESLLSRASQCYNFIIEMLEGVYRHYDTLHYLDLAFNSNKIIAEQSGNLNDYVKAINSGKKIVDLYEKYKEYSKAIEYIEVLIEIEKDVAPLLDKDYSRLNLSDHYIRIAKMYRNNNDMRKCIEFGEEACKIRYEVVKDTDDEEFKQYYVYACSYLSIDYLQEEKYDEAISCLINGIKVGKEIESEKKHWIKGNLGKMYLRMSQAFMGLGNNNSALEYAKSSVKTFKTLYENRDNYEDLDLISIMFDLSASYETVSTLCETLTDKKQALENRISSNEIKELINDEFNSSESLRGLLSDYIAIGDMCIKADDMGSALLYYEKAQAIAYELYLNRSTINYMTDYVLTLQRIGEYYFNNGDYENAGEFLFSALDLIENFAKEDKTFETYRFLCFLLNSCTSLCEKTGEKEKSEELTKKAKEANLIFESLQ